MDKLKQQYKEQDKINKAKERFKYKPLFVRLSQLHSTLKYTRFVFHTLSILTGFYFLMNVLVDVLGVFLPASVIIAGFILITFESVKGFILEDTFNSFYKQNQWLILGVFSVLLLGCSVFLSLQGAKEYHADSTRKITYLQDQQKKEYDSVSFDYSSRIKDIEQKVTTYKQQVSWKGKIDIHNSSTKLILSNYDIEKNYLIQNRNTAIFELKQQHKKQMNQATEDTAFNSTLIIVIAGVNELTILLIYWFIVFYDFSIVNEHKIIEDFAPKMTMSINQFKQMYSQWSMNDNQEESTPILEAKQQGEIGFKVLDSKEETKKNVFIDFKKGLFDVRTLTKKHHINIPTLSKYRKEFNNLNK